MKKERRTPIMRTSPSRHRMTLLLVAGKELRCDVDETSDCVHVGFAYSLPKVYRVMGELGIKPPVIKSA